MCGCTVGGNAGPRSLIEMAYPSGGLLELDAHRAAARRMPNGVVQQIDDQAPNQIFVAGECGGVRRSRLDRTSLVDASTRAARTTSSTTSSRYIGVRRTG